jgi:hypothetical protein
MRLENTPIFPGEWHRKLNSKRITVIAARVEALHFRPQFMSFGPFMEGHGVNVIQYGPGPVWPIMARYNIPLTGAALPAAPAALRHHSALPVGRRGGTRAAPPPRLRPAQRVYEARHNQSLNTPNRCSLPPECLESMWVAVDGGRA